MADIEEKFEQLNIRIPMLINDELNSFVRQTKVICGSKIPKEQIVVEFIRHGLNIIKRENIEDISTIEKIKKKLGGK